MCSNGWGGDSMQQTVRERIRDGGKNIFCWAVMESSTCPHVILYFNHIYMKDKLTSIHNWYVLCTYYTLFSCSTEFCDLCYKCNCVGRIKDYSIVDIKKCVFKSFSNVVE